MKKALLIAVLVGILLPAQAWATDSLCAVVKIQILQELTLERQGFEATMQITNSLDTLPLKNIKVEVLFKDADGNPVTATTDPNSPDGPKFFYRVDDLSGVSAVDGTGEIAASSTGTAKWLIVPTRGAAGNNSDGTLYYVGAHLTYTVGGKEQDVVVAPDSIVVKPEPLLTLDYFLTKNVEGDNPFTTEIEPPVPYTLGLRISNNGAGVASGVKIESAQPKIIDNEQGLAIDFKIDGSYIEDKPAEPTLLLDFGDIDGGHLATGRWIMETSLSGKFIDFDASVSHSAELGGRLTSLIEAANTHFLVKDVLVDKPGRDSVRDFLAQDGSALSVYESENTGASNAVCANCFPVTDISGQTVLGSEQQLPDGAMARSLSFSPPAGFVYAKIVDPSDGQNGIQRVVRSDGYVLPAPNAWISQEESATPGQYTHYINIFDVDSTGQYSVQFGNGEIGPQPPVLQYIPPRTTYEGGQIGFVVTASDPNGDPVTLTAKNLPQNAEFVDKGAGQGAFSWFPTNGQAGQYTVTFVASDGILESSRSVTIQVNPADDKDGDGMADAWELEHFGNLDRDGTADSDGDGYTDLEEYQNGTDPLVQDITPVDPVIQTPVFDQEVKTADPQFVIDTSDQPTNGLATLHFEIYSDAGYTNKIGEIAALPVDGDQVTFKASDALNAGVTLQENQHYFWRIRSELRQGTSAWVSSRFFVNQQDEPPTAPTLVEPVSDVIVDSYRPTLRIGNGSDPDGDAFTYAFYVYADGDLAQPVASIEGVAPDSSGVTEWQVNSDLLEDHAYQWQVKATDEDGLVATSDTESFFVSTVNNSPTAAKPLSPVDDEDVASFAPTLRAIPAKDPEMAPLQYEFELATSSDFSADLITKSGLVSPTGATVDWPVTGLQEDTDYHWRVRAWDGVSYGPWQSDTFFVNTVNEAPSVPTVANPGMGAWVETLQPKLTLNASTDPDRDAVRYEFQLFADNALTDPILTAQSDTPIWALGAPLSDNTYYQWRARAVDDNGAASGWTAYYRFFVNNNGYDDPPTANFILPDARVVTVGGVVKLQWNDQDPDSDANIRLLLNDGTVIAEGISEDADQEGDIYNWDTSTVTPGTYTLSLEISDASSTVTVHPCCSIIILPTEVHVQVQPLGPAETDEAGTKVVDYGVTLSSMPLPGTTVTVNFDIDNSQEGKLLNQQHYFTFDETNWDQPQQIHIEGVDDCAVDGDTSYSLTFSSVTSGDDRYDGIQPASQNIVNRDNEVAGQDLFICDYQVVDRQMTADGHVDITLRALLRNTGAAREGISATGSIASGSQVLSGASALHFPTSYPGRQATSEETFHVIHPADADFDPAKLLWNIDQGTPLPVTQGTNQDDVLHGTDGDDEIDGRNGNDVIFGGEGDDVITGGAGSDRMFGGAGDDDFLFFGSQLGVDEVWGGRGYDRILGGDGDDTMSFRRFLRSASVEEIDGGKGSNVILGTPGRDHFDFSHTVLKHIDYIDLLAGNDRFVGSASSDVVIGGDGDDILDGEDGDDVFLVKGAQGTDTYVGGSGNDSILGSDGDDTIGLDRFSSRNSIEKIDGRGGFNSIQLGDHGEFDFSKVALVNIQQIVGTSHHDVVIGSAGNDVFRATPGDDVIHGGPGNDTLKVSGAESIGMFEGGEGVDVIAGSVGDDSIELSGFTPAWSVERVDGDGGLNLVVGTHHGDFMNFSATQLLSINEIDGLRGNDTIVGSQGPDRIRGGAGLDYLSGQSGADTYVYSDGDGVDLIDEHGDAKGGDDVLELDGGLRVADVSFFRLGDHLMVFIAPQRNPKHWGKRDNGRRRHRGHDRGPHWGGVIIKDWFSDAGARVEKIIDTDGGVIDISGQVGDAKYQRLGAVTDPTSQVSNVKGPDPSDYQAVPGPGGIDGADWKYWMPKLQQDLGEQHGH